MLDLPPDIPVISACAPAVQVGWQEAEACLFNLDYVFADSSEHLRQVEIDYRTARGLIQGESIEDATPQGDTTYMMGELEVTRFDSPFLLANFDNDSAQEGELHRVYEDDRGGIVVLLDDSASTVLMMFRTAPWDGFSRTFSFIEANRGDAQSSTVGSLAETPFEFSRLTTTQELYYRLFPSAYPDTTNWDVLQIEPGEFTRLTGHTPKVIFYASYSVIREY